ncbi:MAG: precorrin-2 dehydrogenase/sirohydrochlorin ferrochelatase family protein [Planctomycetota bacterium]|jgi:precorrin-2 dehydrogenase/sirohydrochlorin ferrochelatase
MTAFYPIYLDLSGKSCLIVGAGSVAVRKIHPLLLCGASVTVVALESVPQVRTLQKEERIQLRSRAFEEKDVEDQALVIAATNDPEVNRKVSEAARKKGIPCNVVDTPDLCDFHVPAVVVRGDLKIAVSTGGKCPAFCARVRNEIDANFSGRYAEALRVLNGIREKLLKSKTLGPDVRKTVLNRAANSKHLTDYLAGKVDVLDPENLS